MGSTRSDPAIPDSRSDRADHDGRVELETIRPLGTQHDQIGAKTLGILITRIHGVEASLAQQRQYLLDASTRHDDRDASRRHRLDFTARRVHEGRAEAVRLDDFDDGREACSTHGPWWFEIGRRREQRGGCSKLSTSSGVR